VWQRIFGKYSEQVRRLLGKLTPSQRLTLGILACTLFVGLVVLAFLVDRGTYVALARHRDPVRLQAMAQQLKLAGYEVRVRNGALEVPEGELPRALSYVAGEVGSSPRRDGWAWLDDEPSWGETSIRQREKQLRARTINLEESIKVCPDIVDALVVLNIKDTPFTVLDSGEEQNSASVTVTLAPGVGRLKPEQVRVIRNIVSGGAPVPYRNVTVTDNRLNMYPVEEDETGGLAGLDERRTAQIKDYRKRIASYLEQTFAPGEYSLFVDIKLQREKIESEAELVEPPKKPVLTEEVSETETGRRQIGGAPGTKPNVAAKVYQPGESPKSASSAETVTVDVQQRERTERRYSPVVSTTRNKRSKPAGEIERISVAVRLDKYALERVVSKLRGISLKAEDGTEDPKARSELEGAIQDYLAECEREITTMLKLHGQVDVSVRKDVLLARSRVAERSIRASGGVFRWAKDNAVVIGLVLLGLGALGFIYGLARRSIPPPIEIPPVEIPEEEAIEVSEAEEESGDHAEIPELELHDEELETTAEQIQKAAREKPQVAATAVKLWLSSDKQGKDKKA